MEKSKESTPDIGALHNIDGETLPTLQSRTHVLGGVKVLVATPECLLRMKEYTINLMGDIYKSNPRPQDLADEARLLEMISTNRGTGMRKRPRHKRADR